MCFNVYQLCCQSGKRIFGGNFELQVKLGLNLYGILWPHVKVSTQLTLAYSNSTKNLMNQLHVAGELSFLKVEISEIIIEKAKFYYKMWKEKLVLITTVAKNSYATEVIIL